MNYKGYINVIILTLKEIYAIDINYEGLLTWAKS